MITVLAEWVWCQVEAGFLVGVLAAATLTGVCFLFRFLELPSAKLDSCRPGVRGRVRTQTEIEEFGDTDIHYRRLKNLTCCKQYYFRAPLIFMS